MKKIVMLCVLLALLCSGCGGAAPSPMATEAPAADPESTPELSPEPMPEVTPEPTAMPEPEPLRAKLTVAGDVVLHMGFYDEALQEDGTYDFSYLFEEVGHYVEEADYASCCFEGAMRGEEYDYSGYPMFCVPDGVAASLKKVGFDLVALASNHGMDGGKTGLDRTIDVMEAAGLDHVGSFRTQEERDENHGVLLKDINGIKIAFLDYTYGTNGISIEKYPYAMNVFCNDYQKYCQNFRYEMFEADMAYAKSLEPDMIAVIMHWGAEYIYTRQPAQTELANYLFSLGADLVLGGHPHVPQPMETVEIDNGDGTTRTGYLCYCLGNLVAHMHEGNHKNCTLTAMVQIEIEKDPVSGKTALQRVEYIPMVMMDQMDYWVQGEWRFRLLDLRETLAAYENGDDRGFMTEYIYRDLSARLQSIEEIMGPELVYYAEDASFDD